MLGKIILLVLVCAQQTQPATTSTGAPSKFNEAGFIVTRVDVAQALLGFERMLHDYRIRDAEQRARVNREFDRLTGLYFLFQYSPAVRGLHELTDQIDPNPPRTIEAKLARAMRVRLAPPIAQPDRRMGLRVKISPMYAVTMDQPAKLRLQIIRDGQANPILDEPFAVESNGLAPILTLKQPSIDVGGYRVDLVAPDGWRTTATRWYVADRPLDMLRTLNHNRLTVTIRGNEQLYQARAAVAARNDLLTDRPTEAEAARYFIDPIELAGELDQEIAQIENQKDPFVNRAGDYWRTVYLGEFQVPLRIYAPKSVTDNGGKPVAMIIALHGSGAEEGMFFDAYGLGEIKRLADRFGFIVVAPRVDIVRRAPDAVAGLVKAMSYDYAIDTKRVYAIGHSLGALTAQSWANASAGSGLAAVVQIAGAGEFQGDKNRPRTLVIGGELDLVFAPDRLKKLCDDARLRGLRVELRAIPNSGHTLIVGDVLPDAVNWLLNSP